MSRPALSRDLAPTAAAQQRRDAAEVQKRGAVPLVVALLAAAGGDAVELFVTTIAVAPRILH